jgi:hypothetical protein
LEEHASNAQGLRQRILNIGKYIKEEEKRRDTMRQDLIKLSELGNQAASLGEGSKVLAKDMTELHEKNIRISGDASEVSRLLHVVKNHVEVLIFKTDEKGYASKRAHIAQAMISLLYSLLRLKNEPVEMLYGLSQIRKEELQEAILQLQKPSKWYERGHRASYKARLESQNMGIGELY